MLYILVGIRKESQIDVGVVLPCWKARSMKVVLVLTIEDVPWILLDVVKKIKLTCFLKLNGKKHTLNLAQSIANLEVNRGLINMLVFVGDEATLE